MLKSCVNQSSGTDPRRTAGLLVIILATVLAAHSIPTAWAVEMASLYTAQVPLDPEATDARDRAYEQALIEVLTRVSGSELSVDRELFDDLFPNPAAYVVQYRPGEDDTLWVSFDGKAIENTLRRSSLQVWGSDRPLTIVWLAVDWGGGRREIIAADDPERNSGAARSIDRNQRLRQRVLDVAERRGLPVVFPLLDSEDLKNVSFSDIWGGFDNQLLAASKRYEANSILVGRVRPASSQRNDWSYYLIGTEHNWTGEPEQVFGLVGDLLSAEFATGGDAPLRLVDVSISGIDSVDAYGAVQQIFAGLNLIENFSITSVDGDQIHYNVATRAGAERLQRALRFHGLIEQDVINVGKSSTDLSLDNYPRSSLAFFYSR